MVTSVGPHMYSTGMKSRLLTRTLIWEGFNIGGFVRNRFGFLGAGEEEEEEEEEEELLEEEESLEELSEEELPSSSSASRH